MREKADTVLDSIRSVLGDHELKQKYMALTIAKSDLLEELGEIKEYRGSSLLFERKQVSYGFMNMDSSFFKTGDIKTDFLIRKCSVCSVILQITKRVVSLQYQHLAVETRGDDGGNTKGSENSRKSTADSNRGTNTVG